MNMRDVSTYERTRTILESVSGVVTAAIELFELKNRKGGYFCITDAKTGTAIILAPIGDPTLEKVLKYLEFCQEKARRLAQNPEHNSSWESRNPEDLKWGGAIRTQYILFSFSGLPELIDEACMLVAAVKLGSMGRSVALRIAETSGGNEKFMQLCEKVIPGTFPAQEVL